MRALTCPRTRGRRSGSCAHTSTLYIRVYNICVYNTHVYNTVSSRFQSRSIDALNPGCLVIICKIFENSGRDSPTAWFGITDRKNGVCIETAQDAVASVIGCFSNTLTAVGKPIARARSNSKHVSVNAKIGERNARQIGGQT